jgi:hypothetical protein
MPKNNEGLILRYHETHTILVDDCTYPHEDVDDSVAAAATFGILVFTWPMTSHTTSLLSLM